MLETEEKAIFAFWFFELIIFFSAFSALSAVNIAFQNIACSTFYAPVSKKGDDNPSVRFLLISSEPPGGSPFHFDREPWYTGYRAIAEGKAEGSNG